MFDMETCISSKIPLQKHSSQQCQRVWSHVFKCWNPCPNRNLIHGKGVVHLYLNWKGLQDVAIWNILKSFPALQSWQKDFLHVPFISIHLIQMLAQHSLQAHLILMFQARVPFFPQLSLVFNLQRHRKPAIHLPFIDHKLIPFSCKALGCSLGGCLGALSTELPRQTAEQLNSSFFRRFPKLAPSIYHQNHLTEVSTFTP